uniref:Transmembrane protein n=1 Tax=Glossina brevipalpis TaxID=37001 RepID=A0A1A9X1H8_9MUSC
MYLHQLLLLMLIPVSYDFVQLQHEYLVTPCILIIYTFLLCYVRNLKIGLSHDEVPILTTALHGGRWLMPITLHQLIYEPHTWELTAKRLQIVYDEMEKMKVLIDDLDNLDKENKHENVAKDEMLTLDLTIS